MAMRSELVQPSTLKHGDTIIWEGGMVTLGKSDVRYDSFLGTLISGICVRSDIERVLFPKWYQGKLQAYVPQI